MPSPCAGEPRVRRVAVVGGSPEPSGASAVRRAVRDADAVVAVDRGLDAARAAGVPVDLFCGDADSVSAEGAAAVRAAERARDAGERAAFDVERYDPHKDFTDLSLVLRAVRERWGDPALVCTCLSGGNPDHLLGVLGCLAGWEGGVELAEDGFDGRILHGGSSWRPEAPVGSRFSFIPLSGEAVVSERGFRWELDRRRVELLSDLGISNVIEEASPTIACHEGTIACWAFR